MICWSRNAVGPANGGTLTLTNGGGGTNMISFQRFDFAGNIQFAASAGTLQLTIRDGVMAQTSNITTVNAQNYVVMQTSTVRGTFSGSGKYQFDTTTATGSILFAAGARMYGQIAGATNSISFDTASIIADGPTSFPSHNICTYPHRSYHLSGKS